VGETPVNRLVPASHLPGVKAFFKGAAAPGAVDPSYPLHRGDGVVDGVHNVACSALFYDFRDGTVRLGNYRSAAGQCLDHDQAEWFRPVNREKESDSVADQFVFIAAAHFAQEFDLRFRLLE